MAWCDVLGEFYGVFDAEKYFCVFEKYLKLMDISRAVGPWEELDSGYYLNDCCIELITN